jgi:hypothetical protein
MDTFANTSSMGTWGNTATKSSHKCVVNLLGVSGKVVGNKRRRLSGDMASTFKKLTKSSKKKLRLWSLNCKGK